MIDRKQFADEIIPLLGKGRYVSYSELDRLRELVKEAYEEGYNTGAHDDYATHYNNGVAWGESRSKDRLEE